MFPTTGVLKVKHSHNCTSKFLQCTTLITTVLYTKLKILVQIVECKKVILEIILDKELYSNTLISIYFAYIFPCASYHIGKYSMLISYTTAIIVEWMHVYI